jgi:outer membrane protein assembly factor BamB
MGSTMHGNDRNYGGSDPVGDGPTLGEGMMPYPDSEMEDYPIGMNAGPFINNNTLYTFSRTRGSQTQYESQEVSFGWNLTAFNLLGTKLWTVTLSSDHLSAPAFGADGKVCLAGRNGMRSMRGLQGFFANEDNTADTRISSALYIVTPGTTSAAVKEVKIENELASSPVVAVNGSAYRIYLKTTVIDLPEWTLPQGSMHDLDRADLQHFLYAFDSNGTLAFRTELP